MLLTKVANMDIPTIQEGRVPPPAVYWLASLFFR